MLLVALFSIGTVTATGPARLSAPTPHGAASAMPAAVAPPTAVVKAPPVHPATLQNIAPQFFNQYWSVGNVSTANTSCNGFCYPMAQNPTLLNLANGDIGLGFSVVTNASGAPASCAATVSTNGPVVSRIAWSVSSNGGQSFAPMSLIGNTGSSACQYFDGIEPSFAVSSNGEIFGAFVAANATLTDMYTPGVGFSNQRPVINYIYRPSAALALVTSDDNGVTWSTMDLILTGGNFSMPRIAVFGDSVYIAYTTMSNSTGAIPGALSDASAVRFVYSLDDGVTWSSPVTLPGHLPGADPTQLDNTMAASIAVSSSGKVGVAYAANRTCFAFCGFGFGEVYADDIVFSTSTTNGSSWSAPTVVARGVSEFASGTYSYTGSGVSQGVIDTTLVWPSTGDVYVAWAQSDNMSLTDQYALQWDYAVSSIYSAASADGGSTWIATSVTGPIPQLDYNQEVFGFGYFNPALGVSNGTVYLAFSHYNWTNGGTGYNSFLQNAFGLGNAEWMTTSPDGVSWAPPTLVLNDPQGSGITDFDYWGYLGSIAFNATGEPIIAYALQTAFLTFTTTLNCPIALVVASPYDGPTTTVTIAETGVTPGAPWSSDIQGQIITTTSSEFNITDAPVGVPIYVVWPGPIQFLGYRAALMPVISEAPLLTASGPMTDWFNFTTFYGIEWSINPANMPSLQIECANFNQNGGYQFYWYWSTQLSPFGTYQYSYGAEMPWYFPAGTWLNFSFGFFGNNYYYGAGFVGYWSGTGNGAYNGSSPSPSIHMLGPINETAWMTAYGIYNESFSAPGLPSASTFSFSVDGISYSGSGGGSVSVPGLGTGAHLVTNISASSTTPGWQYFGYVDGNNPVVVPNQPSVNLSFASVDMSSSPGTVSYHAMGLPDGSPWQLSFNGTEYSSTTPWINVTARDGVYPVEAYPAVASGGNQSFVPSGIGSSGSVHTGTTYPVNFTSAFALDISASTGGVVSPGGGRYFHPAGDSVTITATPNSGYQFGGWSGTGPGSYSGPLSQATLTPSGPVAERAAFVPLVPNRFNVTINESGIPTGTAWSVIVGGVGYSSTTDQIVIPNELSCTFSGSAGRYPLIVPYAHVNGSGVRYVPTSPPTTVCGGAAAVTIDFAPEYSVAVTAGVGGSVSVVASGGAGVASPYWLAGNAVLTISATADSGFSFSQWVGTGPGAYSGTAATPPSIVVSGPISEVAEFLPVVTPPPPTYSVTFTTSASFQPGTAWTVSGAGGSYSSTGSSLVISGLAGGSYTFTVGTSTSPDGLWRYVPTIASFPVSLTSANASQAVQFATDVWLDVLAVGPGAVTPAAKWTPVGDSVALTASPALGASFLGWVGTGGGAYTGSVANTSIQPTGPVTEAASFAATPPTTTTPGATASVWSNPLLWAGLGLVGLVIGLVVGLLLARGRPPAASADEATPPESAPPAPPYEEGPPEEPSETTHSEAA